MSKFHSTVSRRTFMKGLGLAGAGLGAAAATAPVFHDLDEATASPGAQWKRAWYVKEVDEPPTSSLEIDWNQVRRLDRRGQPSRAEMSGMSYTEYYAGLEQWTKDRWPGWKGDTVRDLALELTGRATWFGRYTPGLPLTPEEHGMSKWQGTPEENLRMLRAAFRLWGASDVGCVELNEKTRKLFYSYDTSGRNIVFEDIDRSYATESPKKLAIPNRYKWVIFWTNLQPTALLQRTPCALGRASHPQAYTRIKIIGASILGFLHGLGYEGVDVGGKTGCNGFAALSGSCEHTRMGNTAVSPEYGAHLRGQYRVITDLPLTITKPIDAGIGRFCLTCKKCAETCPYQAISYDGPSWENACGQNWDDDSTIGGNVTMWNAPGFKGWRLNYRKCMGECCACMGNCAFSPEGESFIHSVVKGTISTTPLFNSFLRTMSDTFQYGHKEPESWWDLYEPTFGVYSVLNDR